MKKIIYSVVTALILSIILALIFPTWFLRGDAQWTYLNDTARMDIYLVGNVKNGRVRVECRGPRIIKPRFFSNNQIRGAVVEIPISYRTTSYQVQLTPQADEWGKDVALIVKFLGKVYQYDGEEEPTWVTYRNLVLNGKSVTKEKRKPAWVSYRNIVHNGKSVAGEKVVWHDQPFVLKYPPHASRITLTFDVCKPLKASDFAWMNLLVVFSIFLMLSFFFAPLTRVVGSFLNGKDIVKVLSDAYGRIDHVYRRSFWIIFGVICFAFGFHTIQYMWGNHDWKLLQCGQPWLTMAPAGRYMAYVVKVLFLNSTYLPLIHDLIIFITLAINAVLLCKYWRLEKRVTSFVLCGLVLTAQPFTLGIMYYVHMTPEVFIGVTCALAALLLSEKIALRGGSLAKKITYSLTAIVLTNFSLAMYPVLLNTISVAFVGRLLVQAFDWDDSPRQFRPFVLLFVISATHIVLGIALYKLIITYMFPVVSGYNTNLLPLNQVPERLGILLKQCFHQLYEYNMPFLSQWVLWIFLGFTVILSIYICCTGNLKQKIVRLVLLFGSLFATQTAMIIAATHAIAERVELFGLVFYEVLVMALIITRLRKLRNLWIIAGACIVFVSVIKDLDCLRMWKLGFDAEKMLWNRVLARLEIQKEFDPAKKYDFVLIGRPISMRMRYYIGPENVYRSLPLLSYPYHLPSFPGMSYEFYYPTGFRGRGFSSVHEKDPDYVARLRRLYQAGVLQRAGVWPQQNGLIVWDNIILIVTNGKYLNDFKRRFARELRRK